MPWAGILTGGGDCPALNAVIRAAAWRLLEEGWEVLGVREGWRELIADDGDPDGDERVEPSRRRATTSAGGTRRGTTSRSSSSATATS